MIVGEKIRYTDINLGILGPRNRGTIVQLLPGDLAIVAWDKGVNGPYQAKEWLPNLTLA